ncbi:molybdenum cofactor synthesis domain-containing protein [Dendrosporobacter quercicolus]|uniref:Molybdopterin molybdenumtransferase n=1 Tax=Dendrosporobacter quercicolus TaxID=146817 RepID=A0A1H0AIT0_9FIRM|nr:molybdopterin-binding protein [Dendrosporobacter quercicolus]SDN32983.1 molybdenum cofactor synthesis domain-containing protein [Dendrosporobacter quercicolus]
MKVKSVDVSEAVGMILGQDLTRIVPGEFKGVAFKKGHMIQEQDIPVMRSMGKNNVYVLKLGPDEIHENDAAATLAGLVAGRGLKGSEAAEGKVELKAERSGLLKVDADRLTQINLLTGVALATLHDGVLVKPDEVAAAVKIIPLALPAATLDKIAAICSGLPLVSVVPLSTQKAGLIITGNEVYDGLIQDRFAPVISQKLSALGSTITETVFLPDDKLRIAAAIEQLAGKNDLVIVTGGMSVDPDDVTPAAIRSTGAEVTVYGAPVLPGAMFMTAYLQGKPVLGIPACGMYARVTVLDVVLPKLLAGERIDRKYIAALGHGGLCRKCADGCRYPNCSFAK